SHFVDEDRDEDASDPDEQEFDAEAAQIESEDGGHHPEPETDTYANAEKAKMQIAGSGFRFVENHGGDPSRGDVRSSGIVERSLPSRKRESHAAAFPLPVVRCRCVQSRPWTGSSFAPAFPSPSGGRFSITPPSRPCR